MKHTRFTIITPTVDGRQALLQRALASVQEQTFRKCRHLVVADGDNALVAELCHWYEAEYHAIKRIPGNFGNNGRNKALDLVRNTDYVIFLDDDNLLLPDALERVDRTAREHKDPKVLVMQAWYYAKWDRRFHVLPESLPPKHMKWDALNGCYRADAIGTIRMNDRYDADYYFARQFQTRNRITKWITVEGIVGVYL